MRPGNYIAHSSQKQACMGHAAGMFAFRVILRSSRRCHSEECNDEESRESWPRICSQYSLDSSLRCAEHALSLSRACRRVRDDSVFGVGYSASCFGILVIPTEADSPPANQRSGGTCVDCLARTNQLLRPFKSKAGLHAHPPLFFYRF